MADEYEREHMPGVGAILHRHKVTVPRWIMGLTAGLPFGLAAVAALGLAIGGQALAAFSLLVGAGVFAAFMIAVSVTFATGRVAVSEGQIHIQLGFAGPKIPIAEVASVRVAPSGLNNYGMGAKMLLNGTTVFSLFGDNARAVHIERHGHSPIVLVCKEPELMAQAIGDAIRRHAGEAPRVRVEAAASEGDEAEMVSELAADAENLEHERAKAK